MKYYDMKHEQFCQSCSMPLSEDLLDTEINGSKNTDYCKFCYQDGKFTHPEYTMEEMISHIQCRLDKEELSEDVIESAIGRLPQLKRWKKQELSL
jgi:hypothetical protein